MTDYTEEQETVIEEPKPFTLEELQLTVSNIEDRLAKAAMVIADIRGKADEAKAEYERLTEKADTLETECLEDEETLAKYKRFIATILEQTKKAKDDAEAEYRERDEAYAATLDKAITVMHQVAVEDGGKHAPGIERIAEALGVELDTGFQDEEEAELQPGSLAPTGT